MTNERFKVFKNRLGNYIIEDLVEDAYLLKLPIYWGFEDKEIAEFFCETLNQVNDEKQDLIQDNSYNTLKEWNILQLNDEEEWSHLQILYRLHEKGIECISADIWYNNNIAYLIGAKASKEEIAQALNIHKETIYTDHEHGFIIINLFQEKYLRGCLK